MNAKGLDPLALSTRPRGWVLFVLRSENPMNRIAKAIGRMRVQIRDRVSQGITSEARVEQTGKALDMDLGEFARFQELKSLAFMEGRLSLEEAQYVYDLLGETPDRFNGHDAATKAVLTQVFRELLGGVASV
jgi:hypothetical protein